MREILFRGKCDNEEWLEGIAFPHSRDKVTMFSQHPIDGSLVGIEVIPETVCQYIGRKDKNEVEIFEHDIVETKYGRICEVVWACFNTYCGWDLKPIGKYECKAPDEGDLWKGDNLVVIGNIFDNPELLER